MFKPPSSAGGAHPIVRSFDEAFRVLTGPEGAVGTSAHKILEQVKFAKSVTHLLN